MRVALPYGRGALEVEAPDDAVCLLPESLPPLADAAAEIRAALALPFAGPPLKVAVGRRARVGISVCDVTRPFPAQTVLPPVLDELDELSCDVTIFVATGTHRASSAGELRDVFGSDILGRCRVVQHNAFARESHTQVGKLSGTGTPVLIESGFLDQDVRITTGLIEPHFFAGFSGGPKMVAPGLAALETVMDLHSSGRIGSPEARWGVTFGNPVHDAVRECAAMVPVAFNVDVALNSDKEVCAVFTGALAESHAFGCDLVRSTAMIPVAERFDVVVTTNSGYPLDQNLYQSVKGLSAAAQVVREGGTIVLVSECCDGLPHHGGYGQLLRAHRGPEEFLSALFTPGFAQHDQWQVQIQAQIQRRARVVVTSRGVSHEDLRAAWLEPLDDVSGFLASAAESGSRIALLPDGPQTIPYLMPGSASALPAAHPAD